jgi:putative membrane protein
MLSGLVASLHYLTLALGLGSIFMRGRYLRAPLDEQGLKRLFIADGGWGVAALLWIATGAARAFGGLEKGADYYLASRGFWLKIGLFVAIVLIELWPMITFIRWRVKKPEDTGIAKTLARVNDLEVVLTIAIVFVASAMARGFGAR